ITVVPCVSSAAGTAPAAAPREPVSTGRRGSPTSSRKPPAGAGHTARPMLLSAALPVAPRLLRIDAPHPAQQIARIGPAHVRRFRAVVAAGFRPRLLRHRPLDPLLTSDHCWLLLTISRNSARERAPAACWFILAHCSGARRFAMPVRSSQAPSG